MKFDRVAGSILVIVGFAGYLTVADDLRHVGEFVGVSGVLVSGLILLVGSAGIRVPKAISPRWLAFGILAGLPVGAMLDSMPVGVGIGFAAGIVAGWALRPTIGVRDGTKSL